MLDVEYEIGFNLIEGHNYKKAIPYIEISAKRGNPSAINNLGALYEQFHNYKDAAIYYEKGIKAGNSLSYFNLGKIYEEGKGVPVDIKKAKKLYEKGVRMHNNMCCGALASFYELGIECEKNFAKMLYYLKKGAAFEKESHYDSTHCSNRLAYEYSTGKNIKKNNKKAYELWHELMKNGDSNAAYNCVVCELVGKGTEQNVDDAIRECIFLAVRAHERHSIKLLADIFDNGKYVKQDKHQAGVWLIEGASRDDASCLLRIAEICLAKQNKDYGFKDDRFLNEAIVDFNRAIRYDDCYEKEVVKYNELKLKYPTEVDWEYLETMPNLDEPNNNVAMC